MLDSVRDDLPGGTVTLLLTDIAGSTRLLDGLGEGYADVLAAHREILRRAFNANGGREVDTQGDAFFVAFPSATEALEAVVTAQRDLAAYPWPEGGIVRVRMGLHTGEPTRTDEGYVGMDVHCAARISSSGHGGQALLSRPTAEAVEGALPDGVTLRDLGEHRLKDISSLQRLYQVVIPGLRSDFAPLRSLTTKPNNLPTPPTQFIGRESEVTSVRDLLLGEDVRLVTLTGPGGTGKSRLGLRVAIEILHDFADGAFFVALAPISDAGLVVSAIAQALDVREGRALPLIESLKRVLRDKELLLVLDNFEHVRAGARQVAELLAQCPRVKLLATSREVLNLSGEHEVPVPPMATPASGALPSLAELARYDSVRLFAERARAARAEFALDTETASPVARICRRLDGLPLAIELAAARIRTWPPAELLERLEHRLTVLTDGPIDLPERQQTLRDTIAWSYDLLDPPEQKLCRRLAVFTGGFTANAVAEVCAWDDLGLDLREGVRSLMDKSLVQRPLGAASAESEQRLSMLGTISEYGLELLASSGEEATARERHRDWCVRLAESAEPELRGAQQGEWLARLDREHGNLRAALEYTLASEGAAAEVALRLAAALWLFWYERGHLSEGQRWLDQSLAAGSAVAAALRARALVGAAEMARHLGQHERADELCTHALSIYRELDDQRGIAQTLRGLGVIAQFRGEADRAVQLMEESLELSRELGDTERVAHALRDLGSDALLRGQHERARELYEESLVRSRELGDQSSIATLLVNLGELAQLQGDAERATPLYRESLESFRDLEFKSGIAYCLEALAGLRAEQGASRRAGVLFGASEKLRETIDVPVEPHNQEQYQRAVMAARKGIEEPVFDEAWDEGRALALSDAISLALESDAKA